MGQCLTESLVYKLYSMLLWFSTSCAVGFEGRNWHRLSSCSKIAEAEAAVSVNEKKWLVMHMHVQLQLDELRGPQTLGSL